jgi:hypothetical protein
MKVYCVVCDKFMGEISGKLLPGWRMICVQCEDDRKQWVASGRGFKGQEMPEFFKGIFGGKNGFN